MGESNLKGDMFLDISGERPRTEVKLATEVLQLNDFIMEPRAKQAQFFSAATPVQVDGSFADFGVAPAPGALLGTVIRMLTSVVTVPVQRLFQEKVPEDGETDCTVAFQGGIPEGR